jgi:hypothetical protein
VSFKGHDKTFPPWTHGLLSPEACRSGVRCHPVPMHVSVALKVTYRVSRLHADAAQAAALAAQHVGTADVARYSAVLALHARPLQRNMSVPFYYFARATQLKGLYVVLSFATLTRAVPFAGGFLRSQRRSAKSRTRSRTAGGTAFPSG